MTREAAEARCAELARTDPDRETHRFVPREDVNGRWSVAKVGLPPAGGPLTPETRADEKPLTADDPRTPQSRNAPWSPA